ncbi:uncharacterized protein DKFZp434B061-like [Sorghum bicolor]|uniref:uncharacterized protein DKFZp434B061-like n=1 Tax=Sorghum bicolor TaxID=4558 RepID=UPI000B4239EB|nr:uncharacterized protein DKFZp434B061-like [Sorghum bicolor]|eukprot:XP_021308579.1 uncharacterized protein DKFZp434B061-like [Sorghum bicolor]
MASPSEPSPRAPPRAGASTTRVASSTSPSPGRTPERVLVGLQPPPHLVATEASRDAARAASSLAQTTSTTSRSPASTPRSPGARDSAPSPPRHGSDAELHAASTASTSPSSRARHRARRVPDLAAYALDRGQERLAVPRRCPRDAKLTTTPLSTSSPWSPRRALVRVVTAASRSPSTPTWRPHHPRRRAAPPQCRALLPPSQVQEQRPASTTSVALLELVTARGITESPLPDTETSRPSSEHAAVTIVPVCRLAKLFSATAGEPSVPKCPPC